jgi:hypothetical protein
MRLYRHLTKTDQQTGGVRRGAEAGRKCEYDFGEFFIWGAFGYFSGANLGGGNRSLRPGVAPAVVRELRVCPSTA